MCVCPCKDFRFFASNFGTILKEHTLLLSSYMLYYVFVVYSCNTLCPVITKILFCLQMEATKTDKKPCCRKYRQPHKLEAEYRSRQCDKAWLETHIWHTKRMHMVDKLSYRLAEHSNDKGVRATYRYLRHGCLVSVSTPLNYQQLP